MTINRHTVEISRHTMKINKNTVEISRHTMDNNKHTLRIELCLILLVRIVREQGGSVGSSLAHITDSHWQMQSFALARILISTELPDSRTDPEITDLLHCGPDLLKLLWCNILEATCDEASVPGKACVFKACLSKLRIASERFS